MHEGGSADLLSTSVEREEQFLRQLGWEDAAHDEIENDAGLTLTHEEVAAYERQRISVSAVPAAPATSLSLFGSGPRLGPLGVAPGSGIPAAGAAVSRTSTRTDSSSSSDDDA